VQLPLFTYLIVTVILILLALESMKTVVVDSSIVFLPRFISVPLKVFVFISMCGDQSSQCSVFTKAILPRCLYAKVLKREVKINSVFEITGRMSANRTKY